MQDLQSSRDRLLDFIKSQKIRDPANPSVIRLRELESAIKDRKRSLQRLRRPLPEMSAETPDMGSNNCSHPLLLQEVRDDRAIAPGSQDKEAAQGNS